MQMYGCMYVFISFKYKLLQLYFKLKDGKVEYFICDVYNFHQHMEGW